LFKKIASISLLIVLLFNWVGFRAFISCCRNAATARLETQLDSDQYDTSQLILLKVPIRDLAYYNSSSRFERAFGEIESGGIHYRYVKERLYNDSLELLCIPDNEATRFQSAGNEFFSLVNDLQNIGHDKSSGSSSKKSGCFLNIYYLKDHCFPVCHFHPRKEKEGEFRDFPITPGYVHTSEKPPGAGAEI
jgi:hypothetical protein